jgi:hypothetical protein
VSAAGQPDSCAFEHATKTAKPIRKATRAAANVRDKEAALGINR